MIQEQNLETRCQMTIQHALIARGIFSKRFWFCFILYLIPFVVYHFISIYTTDERRQAGRQDGIMIMLTFKIPIQRWHKAHEESDDIL